MRRWALVVLILLAGLTLGLIALLADLKVTRTSPARDFVAIQPEAMDVDYVADGSLSPLPSPSAKSALPSLNLSPAPSLLSAEPAGITARPSPAAATAEHEMIFVSQVPQHPSQRWGVPYELGTLFSTMVDGTIIAVRVYGAETESGLHTVRIWNWDSASVVAGPYEWDYSGPGWHEFTLPTPLEIQAHTDYMVVVSTGSDAAYDFVSTEGGFDEPILNRNLVTYSSSGLGTQTLGSMPTWNIPHNRNFFRDVAFVPATMEGRIPDTEPTREAVGNTVYYVATDGDNAWSGILAEPNDAGTDGPWRTIQHAADSLQPGDTVYVREGTYYEWVWLFPSYSGTETAPKTFATYPGEEVILDGAVYPTEWQRHSGNIWWTDAAGIDFGWEGQPRLVWQDDVWLEHSPGLEGMIQGTWWFDVATELLYVWLRDGENPAQHEIAVSSLRNAFHLELTSWIVLDGFHIVHYYRGISQMDSIPDQGHHMEGLTVRNCVIEHVGEGIGLAGATFGTWGYVDYSRIENNVIRDTQSDAVWVGSGIDHIVRGNTISDVKQAWYRGFVSAAIILGNADDSIVTGNTIHDVHALGIDVEHFYNGGYGNGNIIGGNTIFSVGQHGIAILGANETRIQNNILVDVQTFGILVNTEAGPAVGNQITNNTIHNSHDRAIAVIAGSSAHSRELVPQDTIIRNNIFSNVPHWAIYNQGENSSADYNLYWQMQGRVANWEGTDYWTLEELQSIGQEAHGVAADPDFLSPPDNLRISEASPAIDAGSNEWAPDVDHWGYPRPWDGNGDFVAVVDIGAHEWIGPLEAVFLPLILRSRAD